MITEQPDPMITLRHANVRMACGAHAPVTPPVQPDAQGGAP